ncbi:MAG: hypothetical protein Q9167_006142 [Letrouitia subvulpina]
MTSLLNCATGADAVALGVLFGINWGHGKLLGLFSGLNAIAFILVYFCVYTTNQTTTLEEYSYVFGKRMTDHIRAQAIRLWHWSNDLAPSFDWKISTERNQDTESGGEQDGSAVSEHHSQQEAYILPHVRKISMSNVKKDEDIELTTVPISTPKP